jgi:hypothetical protein
VSEHVADDRRVSRRGVLGPAQHDDVSVLLCAHLGDAAAHRTGAQLDANRFRAEAGKELVAPER